MAFQNDTIVDDAAKHVGSRDNQPGSGSATAPGGSAAREKSTEQETHGQETYPGSRPGGTSGQGTDASYGGNSGADEAGNETGLNGDTPAAGDVDPDSTKSAEETGQDGDPREANKSTGHPWNG